MADDLGTDLYNFLLDHIYELRPYERKGREWRISESWLVECRKMRDPNGRPMWEPQQYSGPDLLIGYPFSTDENFTTPELVVPDAHNG